MTAMGDKIGDKVWIVLSGDLGYIGTYEKKKDALECLNERNKIGDRYRDDWRSRCFEYTRGKEVKGKRGPVKKKAKPPTLEEQNKNLRRLVDNLKFELRRNCYKKVPNPTGQRYDCVVCGSPQQARDMGGIHSDDCRIGQLLKEKA